METPTFDFYTGMLLVNITLLILMWALYLRKTLSGIRDLQTKVDDIESALNRDQPQPRHETPPKNRYFDKSYLKPYR